MSHPSGHPAGTARGDGPITCRVTPDCRAPAVGRVTTTRTLTGRPTMVAVRPLAEQRIGYASCADHLHHLLDAMLLAALPAPSAEDLQR